MVLHLTLQKKWFDLIRSGKKTEEYREIKPYWYNRLVQGNGFKPYTHIKFTNGYSVTSPTFTIKCTGIRIGRGNPEWGAPIDKDVFILSLGKIVES